MNNDQISSLSSKDLFDYLRSRPEGLTPEEAQERLQRYGPNTLPNASRSVFSLFLNQFNSPMIWLLIGAALISLFVADAIQSLLILLFVFINTFFGFYQEYKSDRILQILKKHLVLLAKVKRKGTVFSLSASQLVPGDIIMLEAGDHIPAEVRFIECNGLLVDESIMSGESIPIAKTSESFTEIKNTSINANRGVMGSTIMSGTAQAIVWATGSTTTIGTLTTLMQTMVQNTNFSQEITKLSRFILALVLITLATVFVVHLIIRHDTADILQLLTFSIALAIAITPEALPTVITFALSKGAASLAAHQVIVKRLSAIEDLGSIEILCTDKTGTITENVLKLKDIYTSAKEQLRLYAALSGQDITHLKKKDMRTSFDQAIVNDLSESEFDQVKQYERIQEVPFSPHRLRSSTLVKHHDEYIFIVRGAYEVIATHCISFDTAVYQQWITSQEEKGGRVLAVAYKKLTTPDTAQMQEESSLTMLGLLSFEDPIKKDTMHAVERAQKLHVAVKILTGDSAQVARAVAIKIKLINPNDTHTVMTGAEFAALDETAQHAAARSCVLFARVNPEQKYTIIRILKQYARVGFLGEGFNDAPALRLADVGIVVQEATDVSREAADIVLLGKSLFVIISGIREGRLVFNNILKYLQISLSSSFGNFYSLAVASFFIDFLPMLPMQILLVNLLSDLPMIAIASDNVDTQELRTPKRYNIKHLALFILLFGLVSVPFDFALFFAFKYNASVLQTNWFIESVLSELIIILSLRTRFVFFFAKRMSWQLLSLVLSSTLCAIVLPYTSLGRSLFNFISPARSDLLLIFTLMAGYLIATEIVKYMYYQFTNNHRPLPF